MTVASRYARSRVAAAAAHALVEPLEGRQLMAATLPSGFAEVRLSGGFGEPTDMAVAPDGRVFVTEKSGAVRVIKNGTLLSTPFITIPVDTYRDRGLDSIALDPNFATNGYVYLYYTGADPANPNTAPNAAVNRLARVTVDPAKPDTAKAGSQVVLLDNIPSNTGYHIGGLLEFGVDGKIYLGTGDGGVAFDAQTSGVPSYSQDLNSLGGKVLRLNADGTIPSDNPFFGQAGKRSEVWAYGLRNPFSGAVDPVTGKIFANDVGQAAWEEVNAITAGANFGWPGSEGNSTNPSYVNPLYTYAHDPSVTYSASVTGGLFYRGGAFPASYTGQYFVADYIQGWIKTVNPSTGAASPFATGAGGVIRMEASADGGFLYLSHYDRAVYKVSYVGAANRAPNAVATATPTSGLAPLTVSFDASGSTDPDGDTLTYTWNFGDGTTATGRTVSKTYTTNGVYTPTLTVSDGALTHSTTAPAITVGAVAPTPVITLPANNAPYIAGDTISFSGSATDPVDGVLPASAFNWSVIFHHETHTHGFVDSIAGVRSGSFVIPTSGETDPVQWYEIRLTVTNSLGLTSTTSVNVNPQKVNLTLASNVPGITLNFDGQPVTTPLTQQAVAGLIRGLGAPLQQLVNGIVYTFVSWSDGGAASHNVSTPATNITYTAIYAQASGPGPFSGSPISLPGRIKVSDYDFGGEGVSFHDLTVENQGTAAAYRPSEGVDLEYSNDAGSPLNLGWIKAGEWVNYTTSVATAGTYSVRARVASQGVGGRFRLEYNGTQVGTTFTIPDTGGWQTYQSVHVTGINLPAGQGVLRLVCETEGASGFAGNIAALAVTSPFSAVAIPGRIEAENFDNGGEGGGYSDTDTVNQGGAYRTTGVDSETTGDIGGGYNVGYLAAGEWLEYTFNAPSADAYTFSPRLASLGVGGTFQLTIDGIAVGGATAVPDTAGWQTYQSVSLPAINLAAGTHVLRFAVLSVGPSGFAGNLNYIDITGATTVPPPPPPPPTQAPYGGTPAALPGRIEAENFDEGGEGLAYHDDGTNNAGGAYRATGVDVESVTDTGGGYGVGYISAGEWLEYSVNFASAGLYDLGIRFASGHGGGTAHIEIDGAQVGGSITLPGTGGWATWTTVTSSGLNLPAGQHVLRLAFDTTAGGDIGVLSWLNFAPTPVPPPPPVATAPAAPTNLAAVAASSTQVNLSWTAGSTNETGFRIERRLGSTGTWAPLGTTQKGQTTYSDSTGFASSNYNYRVLATNAVGDSPFSAIVSVTTLTSPGQSPFSGTPIAMPGILQAEAFDNGGAGAAFNDTTPTNLGGKYRTTAVDIESTTDTGGGFVVASTAAGEWLEYTVNVPTAGWFTIDTRVSAKGGTAGRFHVEADRVNVTGSLAVPNTGAWTTYRNVTSPAFSLSAGTHVLRLAIDTAVASGRGPNVNWLRLNTVAAPAGAATLKSIAALSDSGETQSVGSLRLVDARTGVPIDGVGALTDGATINLASLPTRRIAIRMESSGASPKLVRFSLDGKQRYRTDKQPSVTTRTAAWKLKPGEHTVVATAIDATGAEIGSVTVRFTIINAPVVS
ncbi:carbohydrate-binding protein [Humisphaera borealis]|uniref:Carbohydrate-binding protein n=1 Tax=Humisphaera borealis TaxID=2807512 RepID=A0A7M2X240_9BACT|nr:carbohydrate-binding protein [Humisphaera borealis]QOV91783.1 carbohydrate-binding protein [Humisphaera borealis]